MAFASDLAAPASSSGVATAAAAAAELPIVKSPLAETADEQRRRRVTVVGLVVLALVGLVALGEIAAPTLPRGGGYPLDNAVIESASAQDIAPALGDEGDHGTVGFGRDTRSFRDDKKIVVLLSSGRDADGCARSLIAARELAFRAARVHFRVYEEIVVHHDDSCLQVFCDLRPADCKTMLRSKQLRVVRRDVSGALGASVALHLLEGMIEREQFEHDFYLSVDSNIEFTMHWDLELLRQWYSIGNDRAILSVSPPAVETKGMNNGVYFLQCSARIHSKAADPVVELNPPEPKLHAPGDTLGAALLASVPVLQSQYSERFHFGRVASLLSVRSDPHLAHIVVGHEYMRATRFWTKGFDFYTPARDVLYYRYELPLAPHEKGQSDAAIERSSRRIRRLLQLPLSSPLWEHEPQPEMAAYATGVNRSLAAWNAFAAIDARARFNESTTNHFAANCEKTLHYVHYEQ